MRWNSSSHHCENLKSNDAVCVYTEREGFHGLWVVNARQTQNFHLLNDIGRAIAQAVSRWLPTAAARVQTRV
jgi:hypothetical protein